ncbi:hypothetical protein [Govanella unica]|uniref:Uncharacterized protein n=1 Tax=Govanella unica TaxID=2975056 RepID=A0A9X3TZB5_9PROT|nr:hypothetical protein [Govania unica]MDA5194736.1 hypothetical protein [Govania unica]
MIRMQFCYSLSADESQSCDGGEAVCFSSGILTKAQDAGASSVFVASFCAGCTILLHRLPSLSTLNMSVFFTDSSFAPRTVFCIIQADEGVAFFGLLFA